MPGTPDLMAGYAELVAEQTKVARADQFYDGCVGNVFASPHIRRLLAKAGFADVEDFNYAKIPVDTIARRLRVTSVTAMTVPTSPRAEPKESPEASSALTALRERNQMDFEEPGAFRDACKHGDEYLLVWPVRDEETGKVTEVDMRFNSADCVRIIYDVEDRLKKAYTIKAWTYGEGRVRANLYYDDRIERWVTIKDQRPEDPKAWVSFDEDGQPSEMPNEWGENPWFHLRTDRPYGEPEHKSAYGPQQLINKLVSAHGASIDFQSYPQRYALTDPKADNVQASFGEPLSPFDEVEDPEDDDNETTLKSDPAAVWQLVAKSVGQFPAADPAVFLSPFDRYVQAIAELTQTPLYRFGSRFAQTPSGEALRVADAPTTSTVETRQQQFGSAEQDAYTLALRMLGITDVQVAVKWAPAQTVTDAEGWAVVQQKIATGVPQDVALMETGYTQEQVNGWAEQEADAIGIDRRVELVNSLANAVQGFAAASSLGVVTPDQVQLVFHSLLADMLPEDETPPLEHDLAPPQDQQPALPPGQAQQPGLFPLDQALGAQQDAQYQLVN